MLELDLGNPQGHDLVCQPALGVEKFQIGRGDVQRGHRAAGPFAQQALHLQLVPEVIDRALCEGDLLEADANGHDGQADFFRGGQLMAGEKIVQLAVATVEFVARVRAEQAV